MDIVSTVIMLGGFFLIMYFLMIRPENKRKKAHMQMLSELKVGDNITTAGGLVGKVVQVKEDTITFETGEDRVRIRIMKSSIASTGQESEA